MVTKTLPTSAAPSSTLARVAGTIPIACAFIVINELCERFAYYGSFAVFHNYVQYNPEPHILNPSSPPGAFGKGPTESTFWGNYFPLIGYSSPLLGAFLADQYLGKFKTILCFSTVYMLGLFLLTYSAIPADYKENGTPIFSGSAYALYITSITIIGLGTGGIKALVSPMCADQIKKESYTFMKTEYSRPWIWKRRYGLWYFGLTETQKEYLADPELTIQSVYNWFYWAINIGAVVGQVVCTKLEQSAFWKAFLVPACMFVLAITVFVSGYKFYTHVPPSGSIYQDALHCIQFGLSEKKRAVSQDRQLDIAPGTSFSFLEYAKVPGSPWSNQFVVELQQSLKACSIFPFMTIYWVAYNQMTSNLTTQAAQMAIPPYLTNDLVNNIDPLVLILFIPIFDGLVYPYLNRKNIEFGYIKRITLGIFFGGLSMVVAAVLQYFIYQDPAFLSQTKDPNGDGHPSTISVYWQFIAYFLIAVSEIFASIGSLEYSYTHAPESMKGIVSALALFPNAAASLIGIGLSPFSTDPQVLWVYVFSATGCFVTAALFYYFFYHFDKEDLQLKQSTNAPLMEMKERHHKEAEIEFPRQV